MAILEVLSRSQRLFEERSVVILMYPPHLKDQVKPGAKITMYHGSVEKNLQTLLPANDYAVRHGFAKRPHEKLQPLLFFATDPLTAAAYAIPETVRTAFREMPRDSIAENRPRMIENIRASFGRVYVKELQLPYRFAIKPFIVERIVAEELNQIIVVTNRAISPGTELMTLHDVFQEDPRRKALVQAIKNALSASMGSTLFSSSRKK